MDEIKHNVATVRSGQHGQGGRFYSAYKDRLTLLNRIDDLEHIALPHLRACYQKQAMLVQIGRGSARKVEALAQELQAAENDVSVLKSRLSALENYE